MPPATSQFLNEDGTPSPNWYLVLLGLFNRSGGGNGVSSEQLQTTADNASAVAVIARINSLGAQGGSESALVAANQAQDTATQALLASTALAAEALLKASFGVSVSFFFQGRVTAPVYVPIVQAVTLPANFSGFSSYAGTPATASTTLNVSFIRGGGNYPVGSLIANLGSNTSMSVSGSAAASLQAGDVLVVAPATADVSLANLGITFKLSLT